MIISKTAKEIVIGDGIEIDLGYGPRESMQFCYVKNIGQHEKLFPDIDKEDWISFYVSSSSENFWTIDFSPDHKFNVIEKRKPKKKA